MTQASREKLVVFMDDAALLPDLSGSPDAVIVSLDSQAASALGARKELRIRCVSEYVAEHFASYDELYDHFEADFRERLRPKDSLGQSRFLFEVFWDDILLNRIAVPYIESVIQQVFNREKPTRIEFAISDTDVDALFRQIVKRLS